MLAFAQLLKANKQVMDLVPMEGYELFQGIKLKGKNSKVQGQYLTMSFFIITKKQFTKKRLKKTIEKDRIQLKEFEYN